MSIKSTILDFFKDKEISIKSRKPSQTEIVADKIKGIDLRIDRSVQHLCEVYNKSAGSTRSVLYVLLVTSVLSLISVINTHRDNWTLSRINDKQRHINAEEREKTGIQTHHSEVLKRLVNIYHSLKMDSKNADKRRALFLADSIKLEGNFADEMEMENNILSRDVSERNDLIKNKIENSQTVRVPLLGNSFDINNLAIISGISFILLLIVIRFTLTREKNNLRIALNSISERYKGCIDKDLQADVVKIVKDYDQNKEKYIVAINFKRRRHHYNFLSMNEIFNMPDLDISNNSLQKTKIGKIAINYMYCLPFFIYCVVFINDLSTFDKGLEVSQWKTWFLLVVSIFSVTYIALLCNNCNIQKQIINAHFNSFRASGYNYDKNEYLDKIGPDQQLSIPKRLFYAPWFFTKMFYEIVIILFSKSEIGDR